jgi:hypothetical protein
VTERTAGYLVVFAALAGIGALLILAPQYFALRGFPLDDAWIHAVYGRAIARSGSLAYNPGVPATGATSPLWAALLAIPHLLAARVRAIVVLTKLLGFGLHVLTAVVLLQAFRTNEARLADRLIGALLVAFHPDLIAASVAGMEVPLAALLGCVLLYAARRHGVLGYAVVCAVAPLARPELALLCYAIPLFLFAGADRRRGWPLLAGAALGNGASFGLMAWRNLAVSGLPLPATFYAKVGAGTMTLPVAEFTGFAEVLRQFAITDSSVLLAVLVCGAGFAVITKRLDAESSIAASAFLSGIVYCAVSFALVRPFDPEALYHQRYVLPVLPLVVGSVPILAHDVARRWLPIPAGTVAYGVLLALVGVSLMIETSTRYQRLANDARNIDDVQVATGQALASEPASDVTWAIDAGAIRYFGNTFVVDLMGLNNAQLLGVEAQKYLDEHRPRYVEIVPTWSRLDAQSARTMRGVVFQPTTSYTVTSLPAMQRHWLGRCEPGVSGQLWVRARPFDFACAP